MLLFGTGIILAQGIESVTFSAAASSNDNFQPVVGAPYGASFSGANGSLEISASYGQGTYQQSTLSNENITNGQAIRVYPNPTDYLVNIDLSQLPAGEYRLELLDISAKLIFQKIIQGNIDQIDLGNLAGGSYLLRVTGEQRTETFKIVKRQ